METNKTIGAGVIVKGSEQWLNTSDIKARITIRLFLELETPTHIGSGESGGLLDMPLLRDPVDNRPMISGSTLAGALKAYLTQSNPKEARELFGSVGNDKKSRESWIRVGDARLEESNEALTELRDGVGINSQTRTAGARLKYGLELLQAGSTFRTDIELLVPNAHPEYETLLLCAIKGLDGKIRIGKRKRRGFGIIKIASGKVWKYQFPEDLVRWLESPLSEGSDQWQKLDLSRVSSPPGTNNEDCLVEMECTLESGLLIRAVPTNTRSDSKNLPDQEMIRSNRRTPTGNGRFEQRPSMVIPGTSLAGALRARLERIANTLHPGTGKTWAARMFGQGHQSGDRYTSSRIWVDETIIEQPNEWVHTRVKIDRFTGGAAHGALFSEGLLLPSGKTRLTIQLRLEKAQKEEVGMLLLLIKDLWTGDLTIGGESGIGRGRLRGSSASIQWRTHKWALTGKGAGALTVEASTGAPDLNTIVGSVKGANNEQANA